jgi:LysR family glycine cleavage system transcriptional activator
MQCAIAGMGVAIARRTLITNELDSGRLIAPFANTVATGKRYCLVYSAGALADPRVATVHDWIAAEARGAQAVATPSAHENAGAGG